MHLLSLHMPHALPAWLPTPHVRLIPRPSPPSDPTHTHSPPQVIGRERTVSRLIQILARRTKNNPILLGEPGVGKTAVAEGLALAIVRQASMDGQPLPEFLLGKRVLQLDVGRLISGGWWEGKGCLGAPWRWRVVLWAWAIWGWAKSLPHAALSLAMKCTVVKRSDPATWRKACLMHDLHEHVHAVLVQALRSVASLRTA